MSKRDETEYDKLILGEEIRQSGLVTFFEFLNGSGYVFMIVFPLMIKDPNHNFSNAVVGTFYFFAIIFAYLALRWYSRAVFCLFSRTVVSDEYLIVRSITGMKRLEWQDLVSVRYKPSKQVLRVLGRNGKKLDIPEGVAPLQELIQYIGKRFEPLNLLPSQVENDVQKVYQSNQWYLPFRMSVRFGFALFSIPVWPLVLVFFLPFFFVVRNVEFGPDSLTISHPTKRRVVHLDDVRNVSLRLDNLWGIFRPTLFFQLQVGENRYEVIHFPFSGKNVLPLYVRLLKATHQMEEHKES